MNLESKYPKAALNNIRNYLGNVIAKQREQSDNIVQKVWHKGIYAEPSESEVKSTIKELRKQGIAITEEQEQEILRYQKRIEFCQEVYKETAEEATKRVDNEYRILNEKWEQKQARKMKVE
jgi:hypothetical protein